MENARELNNIPSLDWLENPEVFRVNRIDAHSDHLFYENKEDLKFGYDMPLKQSLNGKWRFAYSINSISRIKDFYKEDYDCSSFDYINVPGHIQMQGYDKCQYVNTMYPWDGIEELRPPHISKEYNPVGSYVKYFELKEELKNKKTYISFQGVETAFYVWLNGNFVGYSEDTFTPSEFELTNYLKEGKNKLAVEVYKRSSASWLEDQDFWRFSGIFRDVYLYATPRQHVKDLFVKAGVDNTYTNGELSVDIKLDNNNSCTVKVYLEDNEGNLIHRFENLKFNKENSSEAREISFKGSIDKIKLWSAEAPNLYNLYIEILDEKDNLIEIIPQRLGFRKFELINNIMCLNGKRIVFKGINRHEFSCKKGRAIGKEDMLWDIEFFKQHNINSVRTSHYPNQSLWYDLCDEYGIYLIDEANLESHGSWQKVGVCDPEWNVPGSIPKWKDVVLDRAESMFQRDKNHPSILIWSCGNESYAGANILEMTQYFHKNDDSRLVHYEGVFWNREFNETSDMESRMYAKPNEIEEYLNNNPEKPYISCEYMHAMGNSCGGMKLYTDFEEEYDMYQGGFIWDYIDQAIEVQDELGKTDLAYGGDFDDRATDYFFCVNGIVYGDRTISPKAQEVKALYSNIKVIPDNKGVTIKNNNLFIGSKEYYFVAYIEKEGKKIFESIINVDIEAGNEKYVDMVYDNIEENGEYTYNISVRLNKSTLWADKGFEIAFGQSTYMVKNNVYKKINKMVNFKDECKERNNEEFESVNNDNEEFKIIHGDANVGIVGNEYKMIFSKQYTGLISLCYNDIEYITEPPKTSFFRAITDNDRGNLHDFRTAQWQIAGMNQKLVNFELIEEENKLTLIYTFEMPTSVKTLNIVKYIVTSDGKIEVNIDYKGVKGLPEIPLFAIDFRLKKELKYFEYYGYGPDENYIDRNIGARLGVYENNAINNLSRYLVPQECGNRTGVRWVKVVDNNNQGLCFSYVNNPFELSVLPYSAYELQNAMHIKELPPVNYTWARIIAKQMGVGGDDSWGAPVHDQYKISSEKDISLKFVISKA